MRRGLGLLPMTFTLFACDSVDTGHPEDPDTPPRLMRIMIQDEDDIRFVGVGRFSATDLFRDADPFDPNNTCSNQDPCAEELLESCTLERGEQMFCSDPLNPRITPPAVGEPARFGGNQIRLVFDQGLDRALDQALATDGDTTVVLKLGDAEVPVLKYLDNGGAPDLSPLPTLQPFGPAIVLKPLSSLFAGATYTLALDPARIKDRDGQATTSDVRGPIQSSYTFTMEDLFLSSSTPDVTSSTTAVIASNDVVQIATNAPVDEMTLPATLTSGLSTIAVVMSTTTSTIPRQVMIRAWLDRGSDPVACVVNPRAFNIVPVDPSGAVVEWLPGLYAILFPGVEAEGSDARLKDAPIDGADAAATFTVTEQVGEPPAVVSPEDCEME
jgi:hypothetical protein